MTMQIEWYLMQVFSIHILLYLGIASALLTVLVIAYQRTSFFDFFSSFGDPCLEFLIVAVTWPFSIPILTLVCFWMYLMRLILRIFP